MLDVKAIENPWSAKKKRLLYLAGFMFESNALVWATVSAGFSIDLGEATPTDEPDIIVVVGDDVAHLMTTAHRVEAAHPDAAVVIAANLVEPSDQLALGSRCDVLITGPLRPLKVLDKVCGLLACRSVELRFVQLTSDLRPLPTELETVFTGLINAYEKYCISGRLRKAVATREPTRRKGCTFQLPTVGGVRLVYSIERANQQTNPPTKHTTSV